eukprot:TRINITY_DN11587_c0_g1_i1.p2 TRINITY_DN11587_c0_g1~~TRINITY_DN11587_c0_g1_i1.p2  ORF type:complete len:608 (+),score=165.89 TRINITY_DN11587_c0_g1_i1:97-1920(+)
MAEHTVVFSTSRSNEFQWRNLYVSKYGECTYKLRTWKDTYLARERCLNLPLLRWVLDRDYGFLHLYHLINAAKPFGPAHQATLVDDIILLYERNTADTAKMLQALVDMDCQRVASDAARPSHIGPDSISALVFARYCKMHGAPFLKSWLGTMLADSERGVFAQQTPASRAGSALSDTPVASKDAERVIGALFLRQLEKQRAQESKRHNRAVAAAAADLAKRLSALCGEMHPGIWFLAVLAQRRFNEAALKYLDVPGFDLRMIGVTGSKEAGNPVANCIMANVVLRMLMLETWLLPALILTEEWSSELDSFSSLSARQRQELSTGAGSAEDQLTDAVLRARRTLQARQQMHAQLEQAVQSMHPDAQTSSAPLEPGVVRVRRELEQWLRRLMEQEPAEPQVEELVISLADVFSEALGGELPQRTRDVLVQRLRSVLRECDDEWRARRQQAREDTRRKVEERRRPRLARKGGRPVSPRSAGRARRGSITMQSPPNDTLQLPQVARRTSIGTRQSSLSGMEVVRQPSAASLQSRGSACSVLSMQEEEFSGLVLDASPAMVRSLTNATDREPDSPDSQALAPSPPRVAARRASRRPSRRASRRSSGRRSSGR